MILRVVKLSLVRSLLSCMKEEAREMRAKTKQKKILAPNYF